MLQCAGATTSDDLEAAASLLLLRAGAAATISQSAKKPEPAREVCNSNLAEENMALKKRVEELEAKCKRLKSCTLSADTVHPKAFKFYTGLQSKEQFDVLYEHLKPNAERMSYWEGGMGQSKERLLSKREELFMVLYRLRTGVCAKEIARMFGISEATLSRVFCSWVNFLDKELVALTKFPTLKEVQKHMPKSFKDFSNTRVVLDCTEVRIQKSSRLKAQKQTFSPYKHYNTCKALVGVTPDGYISFVPNLWGGHVSDSELVEKSGLVDLLQPGDAVMVDKGFRLDAVLPPTVTVHMPPFKKGAQLSCAQVIKTRKIASARIHVERVIRRIKEFHFMDRPIPINMLDIADAIFRSCALLCNFQQPIIASSH